MPIRKKTLKKIFCEKKIWLRIKIPIKKISQKPIYSQKILLKKNYLKYFFLYLFLEKFYWEKMPKVLKNVSHRKMSYKNQKNPRKKSP